VSARAKGRLLSTLGRLALAIIGSCVALWVLQRTGSILLAGWCCFLVQALRREAPAHQSPDTSNPPGYIRFERARCQAEAALARMSDFQGRRRRPSPTTPDCMTEENRR